MGKSIINVENLLLDEYKKMDQKYETMTVSNTSYYKIPVELDIVNNTASIYWLGNIPKVVIERENGKEDILSIDDITPFSYTDDSVKTYDKNLVYRLSLTYNLDSKAISNHTRNAVNEDLEKIDYYKEHKTPFTLDYKMIIVLVLSVIVIFAIVIIVIIRNKRKKSTLY